MEISAIIPTYNRAATLGQAIESVLRQTQPVQEIIVVDDGSTDETRELVASFSGRVRYIFQENRGASAARNTGIRAATCPWLAFLDSDDYWMPEKIQLQEEALQRDPDAVLVYGSLWLLGSDGGRKLDPAVDPSQLWPLLLYNTLICQSAVLVRKDVLLQIGGYDEDLKGPEDWDLWVRLYRRHRFIAVQEPIVVFRTLPNSFSSDAEALLSGTERIMEKTLLQGLGGFERRLWRRRILCARLYEAAICAREAGSPKQKAFLWRSICQWPMPHFLPARWLHIAQHLLGEKRYARLSKAAKGLAKLFAEREARRSQV
jgi:glycosyltransferase involved in cell wall biosynthesis